MDIKHFSKDFIIFIEEKKNFFDYILFIIFNILLFYDQNMKIYESKYCLNALQFATWYMIIILFIIEIIYLNLHYYSDNQYLNVYIHSLI